MNESYHAGYDAGYDDAEQIMFEKVWAAAYDAGYREGHWQASKSPLRRLMDWLKYKSMRAIKKHDMDDIPF